ncbi:hypothetical protein [Pseudogemmobacter sp. W21_MBD1_M6]|uniref:hypothetical protein n=1 Tax=Pseudogemmobacter sp. W21_MBD1_M6 TaxID=3240271 RepID=UPI003F9C6783
MRNDWIIDVLADLKCFAHANGLPALAEQLDDAILVAASELALIDGGTRDGKFYLEQRTGDIHRAYAAGKNA